MLYNPGIAHQLERITGGEKLLEPFPRVVRYIVAKAKYNKDCVVCSCPRIWEAVISGSYVIYNVPVPKSGSELLVSSHQMAQDFVKSNSIRQKNGWRPNLDCVSVGVRNFQRIKQSPKLSIFQNLSSRTSRRGLKHEPYIHVFFPSPHQATTSGCANTPLMFQKLSSIVLAR